MRAFSSSVFSHPPARRRRVDACFGLLAGGSDDAASEPAAIGPGLARLTTVFATAGALVVATAVPLTYYHFGQQFEAARIEAETRQEAHLVSSLISRNPKTWQTETTHLQTILDSFAGPEEDIRSIYDANGGVILRLGHERANTRWPFAPVLVEL